MAASPLASRLKATLDDISRLVEFIPETEQANLLSLLDEWKHPERRKSLRRICSIPVEFFTDGRSLSGLIQNMGVCGAYIKPFQSYFACPGKSVRLSFSLPKCQIPIRIEGEIAWTDREGFGLEFDLPGKHLKEYFEEALQGF